jgi:hypothetical protein
MRRIWKVAGLGLAIVAVSTAPASAQTMPGNGDDDRVVLHGTLVVPADETVGDAVIFDGPATVDGTVEQSLVVFNGDAEISGTVEQDVIVLNGAVTLRSGAVVGGDLISRKVPTIEEGATVGGDQIRVSANLDIGDIGFVSRFAWWLGYSVSTLVLGLLLLLFAPALDGALTRTARERLGGAIGIGAAWFFLLPVAAVVLLVTIVGIPLGLFLLLALALLYTVGYVAGAHGIGRFVMKPPSSQYVAFLVGWGILRLVSLIPVLGGLEWLLTAIFGLGLLAVAARRTSDEPAAATPATPAPPAPVA